MTEGNSGEHDVVRRRRRRQGEDKQGSPDDGDGLSDEDVALLVAAFEDLLTEVPPDSPPELRERLQRLLSSLDGAPGPRVLQHESLELLQSWSEVWVDELEAGRKADADSVRALLLAELSRLNQVLQEAG